MYVINNSRFYEIIHGNKQKIIFKLYTKNFTFVTSYFSIFLLRRNLDKGLGTEKSLFYR